MPSWSQDGSSTYSALRRIPNRLKYGLPPNPGRWCRRCLLLHRQNARNPGQPDHARRTPVTKTNQAPAPDVPAVPAAKTPASQEAPPPPSAEEWQLASTYKLKNSKRYRHNWGQLVRSMMGTAVEGPGQGMVRFRIEIAPDGTLANVKELWSTSETASKLAWQAIKSLPPLPPTPTGKPLIFERTISFMPHETGWPPSYTLDCLPDPPVLQESVCLGRHIAAAPGTASGPQTCSGRCRCTPGKMRD